MRGISGKQDEAVAKKPLRVPIRLHWMLFSGIAIGLAVLLLTLIILNTERDAWLESQASQAEILVERLADELKIPALAGSSAEVDKTINSFLRHVPAVVGAHFLYASGTEEHYGEIGGSEEDSIAHLPLISGKVQRLSFKHLWFAKKIIYSKTNVGSVAVHFSEEEWQNQASELVQRMLMAATFVIALFSIVVYWIAGRMSKPLEALARAARLVARGDFSIRLRAKGNNEISDAVNQFNEMVKELAHKKEIREVFSRYLNPKLVEGVFANGEFQAESVRRTVTVLFADMVGFTEFSEATPPEDVVETLDKYFEIFHRITDYFDGHVDKYIGDALMAVFNHPNEDSDHVNKAVMAGLAMSGACKKLGIRRHTGKPIEFRFGINSGEAIIGNLGAAERLEYTVIGDAVNVASRMATVGHGGVLILSHTTFTKLDEGFGFHSLGKQEISGISQRIECGNVTPSARNRQQLIHQAVNYAFELGVPGTKDSS